MAANANYCGLYIVWCADNSDTVGALEIKKGSSLTVTPNSNGKLTITPSSTVTLTVSDIVGRGDEITISSN